MSKLQHGGALLLLRNAIGLPLTHAAAVSHARRPIFFLSSHATLETHCLVANLCADAPSLVCDTFISLGRGLRSAEEER